MKHDALEVHKFASEDGKTLVELNLRAGQIINCMVFLEHAGKVDMPIGEFVELSATLAAAVDFIAAHNWQDGDWEAPAADKLPNINVEVGAIG